MLAKFVISLSLRSLAFASVLAMAGAAEAPHPLMGATREQVLVRLGEPKSQISSGNRSVLLYAGERLTLRDGVVVEVEVIGTDPAVRRAAEAAPSSPTTENAPAPREAQPAASAAPTPKAEPKVEIKLVRPPSAPGTIQPAPAAPRTESPAPAPQPPPVAPVPSPAPAAMEPSRPTAPAAPAPSTARNEPSEKSAEPPVPTAAEQALAEKLAAEAEAKEMKAKAIEATRRRLADAKVSNAEGEAVSPTLIYAGVAVLVAGVGFFFWRWRQRQIELAATSVANTPVSTGTTTAPFARQKGAAFTEEYLAQLDPVRFEILVASYFNKTGVVASRAKASPGAVTQIQISWKGEPKPFAGVLCIAEPAGPIEPKSLTPMLAELEAIGIRRGHVVTTGKFTAAARTFAAEKQLTLLAGDALLEKLNALPEAARREIQQAVVTGESTASA